MTVWLYTRKKCSKKGVFILIDIHSHILPAIDDGPERIEESIAMITEAKNNGFTSIICTSHYGIYEDEYSLIPKQEALIDKLNKYNIELYIRK